MKYLIILLIALLWACEPISKGTIIDIEYVGKKSDLKLVPAEIINGSGKAPYSTGQYYFIPFSSPEHYYIHVRGIKQYEDGKRFYVEQRFYLSKEDKNRYSYNVGDSVYWKQDNLIKHVRKY